MGLGYVASQKQKRETVFMLIDFFDVGTFWYFFEKVQRLAFAAKASTPPFDSKSRIKLPARARFRNVQAFYLPILRQRRNSYSNRSTKKPSLSESLKSWE